MSRLLIPNTFQIPNVLVDKVMAHVSGAAFKVVSVICRLTYGFGMESRKIGITEMSRRTGLSRPAVIKGIKELGELVMLKHAPQNSRIPNEYGLNINISTGELINNFDWLKKLTSQESKPELVKKVNQRLVKKVDSLKPNKSKPNLKPKGERAHTLPDDFTLTPERREYAVKKGIKNVETVFETFQTHYLGNEEKRPNWEMMWRKWVLREPEFERNGKRQSKSMDTRVAVEEGKYAGLK